MKNDWKNRKKDKILRKFMKTVYCYNEYKGMFMIIAIIKRQIWLNWAKYSPHIKQRIKWHITTTYKQINLHMKENKQW